jgi:hypothetical protein
MRTNKWHKKTRLSTVGVPKRVNCGSYGTVAVPK